jgi:hypothetical protein
MTADQMRRLAYADYDPNPDHSTCDGCCLDIADSPADYVLVTTCRCCRGCHGEATWTLRELGADDEPGEPYCRGCLPRHESVGFEAWPIPRRVEVAA